MPQEIDEKWSPLVTAEAVGAEQLAVLREELRIVTFQRNDALELAGRYYERLNKVAEAVREGIAAKLESYGCDCGTEYCIPTQVPFRVLEIIRALDLEAIVRGVK